MRGDYERCAALKAEVQDEAMAAACRALAGANDEAKRPIELRIRRFRERRSDAYVIARLYVAVGDHDHAFVWLGHALEERSRAMLLLDVDPFLKSLRPGPRFAPFVSMTRRPD